MTFFVAAESEVISHGLTTGDWIEAGAVLAAGIAIGTLLRHLLNRRLRGEDIEPRAGLVAARMVALVVTLTALVYALGVLGVRLGPLLGAIGIGGIAVALAAQSMLSDLIASVLLQTRRPFHRGDQIETEGQDGRVEDINFRTVILRSFDGQRVYLPCSKVLNGPIVNYTTLGRRRSHLTIGVGYDADLRAAAETMRRAAAGVDGVHTRPAPEALVTEFAESSVNLDLYFWHAPDNPTTLRVRSAVAVAAKEALDRAGIEIPFPQRVLHVVPAAEDQPRNGSARNGSDDGSDDDGSADGGPSGRIRRLRRQGLSGRS